MNSLKSIKDTFQKELLGLFPNTEITAFFYLLVEKELGYSKAKTILNFSQEVSLEESDKFYDCLQRLKKQEPIQYILGETEFFGFPFKVTPATLIPRPETEELVAWMMEDLISPLKGVKEMPIRPQLQILDIGTGSGCIAISLAKMLSKATVFAMDISKNALTVASENARNNKVEVHFIEDDILKLKALPQTYDVIVSNPPYVRISEKEKMQKNVLDFEPATALFVKDNNPLLFYEAIATLARKSLNPQGLLYFEINEYLSKEVIKMLEKEGFKTIELRKDTFKKDRMIKCSLSE
ncbi:MAG: peptide chain release factor N(5)-glutamine methyltransferase [Flavobacteriaceae bacterium]